VVHHKKPKYDHNFGGMQKFPQYGSGNILQEFWELFPSLAHSIILANPISLEDVARNPIAIQADGYPHVRGTKDSRPINIWPIIAKAITKNNEYYFN